MYQAMKSDAANQCCRSRGQREKAREFEGVVIRKRFYGRRVKAAMGWIAQLGEAGKASRTAAGRVPLRGDDSTELIEVR